MMLEALYHKPKKMTTHKKILWKVVLMSFQALALKLKEIKI